ncbi:MAG: hypothetical protein ACRDKZ_14855 [Actinomycetota bacterium]
MNETTKRLIAGLLTFLVGLAVGMAAVYFFREPERTSVEPIVVETAAGSNGDARPGKKPGKGSNKPSDRKRPQSPRGDSGGGAVPVQPPPPPPAGIDDDDDDDVDDDDGDDDDGGADD